MSRKIIAIILALSLALAFSPVFADENSTYSDDSSQVAGDDGEQLPDSQESDDGQGDEQEIDENDGETGEEQEDDENGEEQEQDETEEAVAEVFLALQQLQDEIDAAAPGDTIVILGDVELTDMLIINKSLTFSGDGVVTLFAKTGRHMEISGNDITVSFVNVTLSGDSAGGGIKLIGSNIRLKDAVVTRCSNVPIKAGNEIDYIDAGGAVYIETNTTAIIDGGSFTENTSVGVGGAVFVQNNSTVTFTNNPVLSKNEVGVGQRRDSSGTSYYDVSEGGAVCAKGSGSKIIIESGTFTNNMSKMHGGAIYCNGKVEIYSGNVDWNTVSNINEPSNMYGGGVYANWLEMDGGSVSYNTVTGNARLSMGGGGIYSGTTSSTHTNLNVDDTEYGVVINGGVVSYNEVTPTNGGRYAIGGGICSYRTIITGGTITQNTADPNAESGARGGGIAVRRPFGVFEMTGGTVSENTSRYGGGIYMECPTTHPDGSIYGISEIGGTAVIKNNKASTAGGGIAYYNEIPAIDFYAVIGGQAIVTGNTAPTGGGVTTFTQGSDTNFPQLHLTVQDNAVISYNTATTSYGGGIYANLSRTNSPSTNKLGDYFTLTIKGNAKVNNNTSASSGGGITGAYATIYIQDNAQISGNTAAGNAGGIFAAYSYIKVSGNVEISENTAQNLGGGIALNKNDSHPDAAMIIEGQVQIIKNTSVVAGAGGGGLYAPPAYRASIKVGENVVFAGNRAALSYYMTAPSDIDMHNTNVLTKNFTNSVEYGYNNNDINYSAGDVMQQFTVTFDSNGGSSVASIQDVFTSATIKAPNEPQLSGFVFDGWYRDPDSDVRWDFAVDRVYEDITLYAKWTVRPSGGGNTAPTGDNTNISTYATFAIVASGILASLIFFDRMSTYKKKKSGRNKMK